MPRKLPAVDAACPIALVRAPRCRASQAMCTAVAWQFVTEGHAGIAGITTLFPACAGSGRASGAGGENALRRRTFQSERLWIRSVTSALMPGLLMYPVGASPAVCATLPSKGADHKVSCCQLAEKSLYLPHATSLRMSDLATHNAQSGLNRLLQRLDSYIASISRRRSACRTQGYDQVWVRMMPRVMASQLNTPAAESKNEFYSPIRPKRVDAHGEKPVCTPCVTRRGNILKCAAWIIDPFRGPCIIEPAAPVFSTASALDCALQESPRR